MAREHRWGYRLAQFWLAAMGKPTSTGLQLADTILSAAQFELFLTLQNSEQAHAVNVLQQLILQGYSELDLFQAALLHDVGKARYPLRLWERVWIVLGQALWPTQVEQWGDAEPRGWKRAFVIAKHHPAWGAAMAQAVDSNPNVVALIAAHQDPLNEIQDERFRELLLALKAVDDEN